MTYSCGVHHPELENPICGKPAKWRLADLHNKLYICNTCAPIYRKVGLELVPLNQKLKVLT